MAKMNSEKPTALVFGPVPSRRLGRSLGINNIPPKVCSYSCVYCQLGRTPRIQVKREAFYDPDELIRAVRDRVNELRGKGERIDYLTFVPDGEPTLDLNLGKEISALKDLGIPIAVITNASLIFREEVQEELSQADWVSLKVDAAREATWKRINRPHKALSLKEIQTGILGFAHDFSGTLATETMLVSGVNDSQDEFSLIASFLREVKPAVAYLAVPTRPPAEPWVVPPTEEVLTQAYVSFGTEFPRVELLIGYEGNAFSATGDAKEDLLAITAVHPMREEAVRELLAKDKASWEVVEELVRVGALVRLEYGGHGFYFRALPSRGRFPAQ
jgi:wyosine [tRNA(Phe)-imidazoG37] synthetase (radical SAM superfamily)